MNKTTLFLMSVAFAAAVACKTTKKAPAPETAKAPAAAPVAAPSAPTAEITMGPMTKPSTGIFAPGVEQLTAIQTKFNEVSLEQLNEGYTLYTKGACINCHSAKNIYKRSESDWKHIIDDMSLKAKLTDSQKSSVFKYVLSIKATQPAGN